MLARILGRNKQTTTASSPVVAVSPKAEETPEQEEIMAASTTPTVARVIETDKAIIEPQTDDNNNAEEQEFPETMIEEESPVKEHSSTHPQIKVEDIQIELSSRDDDDDEKVVLRTQQAPEINDDVLAPAGWVCSLEHEPAASWPVSLCETLPATLRQKLESKAIPRTPLEKRMIRAHVQRSALLSSIQDKNRRQTQRASYLCRVKKDLEATSVRQREQKLAQKLEFASERREQKLADISQSGFIMGSTYPQYEEVMHEEGETSFIEQDQVEDESSMMMTEEDEALMMEYYAHEQEQFKHEQEELAAMDDHSESEYWGASRQSRFESAIRFRDLILKEISKRAGKEVARARLVASQVAAAEVEQSEMRAQVLTERLERASIRRHVLLDRVRVAAGRHSNYVKSVTLTCKYMDRRSAQMLQHQLDSASFRRDVQLEEIKSNARQANLSAQFRACCAYRLLDAKWLNTALRTTAKQNQAHARRSQLAATRQSKLALAADYRREVARRVQRSDVQERTARALSTDVGAQRATSRRHAFLARRVAKISERRVRHRARRLNAHVARLQAQKWNTRDRCARAAHRRALFLETRVQRAARRNWHSRVARDRVVEFRQEEAAQALGRSLDKLEAAEARAQDARRPVFAELGRLRGVRATQVLLARSSIATRLVQRKEAFARLRQATIEQARTNAALSRVAKSQRVSSNREFMSHFYSQVVSNTTLARGRGAELRRALYLDAVQSCAFENMTRAHLVAQRREDRALASNQKLNEKLSRAQDQRMSTLETKRDTAAWFLGKVTTSHSRMRKSEEMGRLALEEKLAQANLRRAIHLTSAAQTNAQRSSRRNVQQTFASEMTEMQALAIQEHLARAKDRREAAIQRKVQVAQKTSSRVSAAKIEKQAEGVVDSAIRSAVAKTLARNAEVRRADHLGDIASQAATKVSYAKGVAAYQKELHQVRAEVALEQSKLRVLQTSKRRDELMSARKLGQSTLDQLKPYAGLQVVGHAVSLLAPHNA